MGFSDCTFMQWDNKKTGLPSIEVLGGTVSIRGCEFMENKQQVVLGKQVERAIVSENLFTGKKRIDNNSKGAVLIKDNLGTPTGKKWDKFYKSAPGFRANQVRKGMRE